ncbi:MAG: hypothetical protein C7B46_00750 [Sulfobacillus benefaciens]|uniref:Uncharacterized protein n=1 Tax=Sulfobacillus benefaciens TaxID=453960 RepID=A0A2T2XM52_9FIRM|nr:MAG: hypothetical protein C7B46_00750 [Sulfobacillus benefaciens]
MFIAHVIKRLFHKRNMIHNPKYRRRSISSLTRRRVWAFLPALGIIISGCGTGRGTQPPTPRSTTVVLSSVVTKTTSRVNRVTPKSTVLHEVVWDLSNGHTVHPMSKNVILANHIGDTAVVVVVTPETSVPWYNYIFLQKKDRTLWTIVAYMTSPEGSLTQGERGLSLPNGSFRTVEFKVSDHLNTWVFQSGDHLLILLRQLLTPQTFPGYPVYTIHGIPVKINKEGNVMLFVYQDEGVQVSGYDNFGKSSTLRFLKSLPPVTSSLFPFRK